MFQRSLRTLFSNFFVFRDIPMHIRISTDKNTCFDFCKKKNPRIFFSKSQNKYFRCRKFIIHIRSLLFEYALINVFPVVDCVRTTRLVITSRSTVVWTKIHISHDQNVVLVLEINPRIYFWK